MNKVICFVLCTILLSGCSDVRSECNTDTERLTQEPVEVTEKQFNVWDIDWDEFEWNDDHGVYHEDAIPDAETALAVATAIFENMEKSSTAEKFAPQEVSYDAIKEIWVVSFWEEPEFESEHMVYLGYCCSIAMQKSDGKVLKIWFAE